MSTRTSPSSTASWSTCPSVPRWRPDLARQRTRRGRRGCRPAAAGSATGSAPGSPSRSTSSSADGRLAGPVAFTRDHFDSGGMTHPHIGTEAMADGSECHLRLADSRRSLVGGLWGRPRRRACRRRRLRGLHAVGWRHDRRRRQPRGRASASAAGLTQTAGSACCATRTPVTPMAQSAASRAGLGLRYDREETEMRRELTGEDALNAVWGGSVLACGGGGWVDHGMMMGELATRRRPPGPLFARRGRRP